MTGPVRRPGAARPPAEPQPPQVDRALVAIYGRAPDPAACRSCGVPIYFVPFEGSGRLHPVNADPTEGMGSIAIENGVAVTLPKKDRKDGVAPDGRRLLKSHYATCPDVVKWRRKR